jgi:ubiquinone/menaquinone biosynthesis C-methylase UbiE
MKNPKEFWDNKHMKQDAYWLTGSPLKQLCDIHRIDPPSGQVVLEVGVGKGHATREMAKSNDIYVVDISQKALDNLGRVGQKYLTKDMPQIPDNSIDFAICHLVFQHCEDDAAQFILDETIRVLKPDGLFVLQSGDSPKPEGANIERTRSRKLIWRTPDQLKRMITDAGGQVSNERLWQVTSDIYWQLLKISKNI